MLLDSTGGGGCGGVVIMMMMFSVLVFSLVEFISINLNRTIYSYIQ